MSEPEKRSGETKIQERFRRAFNDNGPMALLDQVKEDQVTLTKYEPQKRSVIDDYEPLNRQDYGDDYENNAEERRNLGKGLLSKILTRI